MEQVSIREATDHLQKLIQQLNANREPIVIEAEGKPVAVLITYQQLEKILEIEENQELIEQHILKTRQQIISLQHDMLGLQTENRRIQD